MAKSRLVNAAPLEEFFDNKAKSWTGTWSGPAYATALERVKNAPTVDAVEVVHAYWIKHEYAEEENGLLVPNYECSACHSWERYESYYCPNCGAKMDGDGNGT